MVSQPKNCELKQEASTLSTELHLVSSFQNCEFKQEQSNSFYILNYSLSLFSLCKNKICVLSFFIFYKFCCSSQSLSLSSAACSKSRLAAALFISLVSSSMIFSLLSSSRYSINSLAEGFSNVACLAILS